MTVQSEVDGSITEAPNFHPYDPVASRDPFGMLAELRTRCPVSRPTHGPLPPALLFTKYEDVCAILRDRQRFSNIGMALSREQAEQIPLSQRIHFQLNFPEHTDVRRLLNAAIAAPTVKRAQPEIERIAAQVVDDVVQNEQVDLVATWASKIPAMAIAAVLGLPESDAPVILEWVQSTFTESVLSSDEYRTKGPTGHSSMNDWFSHYLGEQMAIRRNDPAAVDDGMRRIVRYELPSGRVFSDDELKVHIHSLLVAANETTTSFMSNLIHRILRTPGLVEQVRADRSLIPLLMEESLRHEPVIQMTVRLCEEDTEVNGTLVKKDEVVIVSFPSANRDEEIWGLDSATFVPTRFANEPEHPHLGFGLGVHNCPGAHLARLTTEIGVNALLDRVDAMRLADGYEYDKVFYFMVRRPRSLDVVLSAPAAVGAD